jgi:hypothetical protein
VVVYGRPKCAEVDALAPVAAALRTVNPDRLDEAPLLPSVMGRLT